MFKTLRNTHKIAGLTLGIGLLSAAIFNALPDRATTTSYIIHGADLASVKAAVRAAGGEITHELAIIETVGAQLNAE